MEELPRHVAPGGLRRMVIGFACGLAAGAIIALVLPRDDGPRRRTLSFDPAPDATLDDATLDDATRDPVLDPGTGSGERRGN